MSETKPDTKFIHLHVHSHYSLLNALPTSKELATAAKADGQSALAITDNGALYGVIDFYKACTKEKIKPIIGVDAYLAPRTRHDKDSHIDKPRARLVLLAKTFKGYQNLIKLVTVSNTEGFYYKPRIDDELLTECSQDLVCIIPSFAFIYNPFLSSENRTVPDCIFFRLSLYSSSPSNFLNSSSSDIT